MLFTIFRRLRRLMAAAVGEGGVEHMKGAGVLELALKVVVWFPTERALFICVSASWVFSWASLKEAACCPIRSELPGSPPSRGLVRGPRAGEGAQRSDRKEKLELQTNKIKQGVIGCNLTSWIVSWIVHSGASCWINIHAIHFTYWSSLARKNRGGKSNKAQIKKENKVTAVKAAVRIIISL